MASAVTERSLTPKQQLFIDALLSEAAMGDVRIAMTIAGYSSSTKAVDVVRQLRTEVREATETLLALHSPRAVYGLLSVLDDPTALGARNQISASKEVLDRVGITAKTAVDLSVSTGPVPIFILPPKDAE